VKLEEDLYDAETAGKGAGSTCGLIVVEQQEE